jgi:hypothetical protein
MSTTGHVRQRRPAGSKRDAADQAAADRTANRDTSKRASGGALAPRAVRVRNAVLQHAAVRLGLPMPANEELAELPADASLAELVDRWRARHAPDTVPRRTRGRRSRLVLKAAWVTVITVLGLALSYGPVQ